MCTHRTYQSGGHLDLLPGTVYFMHQCGAFGGVHHAIHAEDKEQIENQSKRWCGFFTRSSTLVFRPYLKRKLKDVIDEKDNTTENDDDYDDIGMKRLKNC